jgi:hypothetical protein
MTNLQLYLAIGVPVVLNTVITVTMFTLLSQRIGDGLTAINQRITDSQLSLNQRLTDLSKHMDDRFTAVNDRFDAIDTRFTDLRTSWHDGLLRVEGIFDARLKQLEERGRA